jgi:hypothetical protein
LFIQKNPRTLPKNPQNPKKNPQNPTIFGAKVPVISYNWQHFYVFLLSCCVFLSKSGKSLKSAKKIEKIRKTGNLQKSEK